MKTPADPDNIDSIDWDFCDVMAPLMQSFTNYYFRLEVEGLEQVPHGPALVVGNHNSGVGFFEALGVGAHWYLNRGRKDIMHGLGHDAVVSTPYLSRIAVRMGIVRASHENANALFAAGRKVMVFPGGNREAFRPYKERHKIAFGDRRGFIRLALKHSVPIIPVVYIGGHEGFFILHDGQFIAKLLKLDRILRTDTWPLMFAMPWGLTLGPWMHMPLPTKCKTRYLEPISLENYSPEDVDNPQALDEIYDKVTTAMQIAMDDMATERTLPILG
ncbi:MAG: acyltransferase family protein [Deltaproteobacteria bacterium]|nr:acyltransferase family protein [Deltaproteobacteria bacterium]MBT6435678.1 acyltransferase family protein [Deltaproteobacteria bacterium]